MKMNLLIKKLTIFAVVAAIGTGLVACSGNTGAKKEDTKAAASTLDKEELVLGFDDTFVPMGFKDESGKVVGFDIDLAEALAKKKVETEAANNPVVEETLEAPVEEVVENIETTIEEPKTETPADEVSAEEPKTE